MSPDDEEELRAMAVKAAAARDAWRAAQHGDKDRASELRWAYNDCLNEIGLAVMTRLAPG